MNSCWIEHGGNSRMQCDLQSGRDSICVMPSCTAWMIICGLSIYRYSAAADASSSSREQ